MRTHQMMGRMSSEVIGRDAELAIIHAFLDSPDRGAMALVLEGEAGIGKSTLWLAGVEAAIQQSVRVLVARPAEAEQALSNAALGDLFADVREEELALLAGPRRRAFESTVLLRDTSGGPVDPRTLGVAVLTLLSNLASGPRLVIAVDDVQWLDLSSAATLAFALRRLPDQPLRLLLARRRGNAPTEVLEGALGPSAVQRLAVGPVSLGAIQLLVRRRLDINLSRPALTRLHEASGGNPFYALELARARLLDPDRDTTASLEVPPSLERLVGARLEALDVRTRRALLLLAAHGRIPVELLPALPVGSAALDRARAANVIESVNGVVRFTHPLLASTLYQLSTEQERHAAHRRLAEVFEDPVERGRHVALGTVEPGSDVAAELDLAMAAALDRGLPIVAAELGEHALRLTLPGAIDDRHRRAIATARAHVAAGEGHRVRAIVADLLAREPSGPRRAEALVLRAELEQAAAALPFLLEALTEAAGVPALEAAIHAALADRGALTNGRDWAERHARAAVRLAEETHDDSLIAGALSVLALRRFDRGDPHALELAERAYRLASSLADPRRARSVGWNVGHVLTWSGQLDQARTWLEHELDTWRNRDELVRWELLWYLGLVELWAGRWAIASEHAEASLEVGIQYGLELPQHHLGPALVALHRGQLALARQHSRRALSLATGELLSSHIAILAICDLWTGNAAEAVAGFERAERAADARGLDEPYMREWRAEYVEALLQLGRIEEAASLAAGWGVAATRLARPRVLAEVMRCNGLIAAATGDLAVAVALLEEAVDRHAAAGDPFGRGRTLLALGSVKRRMRQKRAARAALQGALDGFEALGATSWAAAVRAELGRIGGRQRVDGLSPSELRVAELVALGRTNREIATELFLGERTVASHLTHAYSKLGIRSRTELARYLQSGSDSSAVDTGKVPTS